MIETKRKTLGQYATRRLALAGVTAVKDHFPYCHTQAALTPLVASAALHSFAHYDYLALAADPRIRAAATQAVSNVGVGASASRLVGGELALHQTLERDLSTFLGVDDCLAMVSGYSTNVTLVSHLLTSGDVIFVDEASHNSLMVGTQLSRAQVFSFAHNDLAALTQLLEQARPKFGRALLVIEGLYSMDGDIPDLPRMLALCRAHNVWLMIDEAHSIGVLGATGRGITEHFGIDPAEVDVIVGTLSKAFVSCGGFIAAKKPVIEWLRFTLPGFVYSVGLPPPSVAAAIAALAILRAEPERLARLTDNGRYFLHAARRRGLDVGSAIGAAVIPVLFPDVPQTIAAANILLNAGYYVPPIVQIAVPKEAPRLRFFVTAGHTHAQIDGALDAISHGTAAHVSGSLDRRPGSDRRATASM